MTKKVLVSETNLVAIADAIRGKNGTSDTYKPSEMGPAIANIKTRIMPKCHIEFRDLTAEELDISWLLTDFIEDFSYMFSGVPNLKSVDLTKVDAWSDPLFNTSNAKDMSYMFYKLPKLTNLDLSTFDTSQVTDMTEMFDCGDGDVHEKHIDFRNADFSNVKKVGFGIFVNQMADIHSSDYNKIVVIVKDDDQKNILFKLLNPVERLVVAIRTVAEL